jgi:hypothetical protein
VEKDFVASVAQKPLLIWWSTNTRAAAVLGHFAMANKIPIILVVDTGVLSPPESLCAYSYLIHRERTKINEKTFLLLLNELEKVCGSNSIVVAPTSEYLIEALVSARVNPLIGERFEIPFESSLPYRTLSSKKFLNEINSVGYEGLVATEETSETNLPFVAKPKFNVVEDTTLKPFIVNDTNSLARFNSARSDFYAQQLIGKPSIYWCSYTNSEGKTVSYFQENLLQEVGGGSISHAKLVLRMSPLLNQLSDYFCGFLESIKYRGPLMAEFRGENLKLIEINPRFWGPLLLDATNNSMVLSGFFRDYFNVDPIIPEFFIQSTEYLVPKLLDRSVSVDFVFDGELCSITREIRDLESETREFLSQIGGDWL